MTVPVFLHGPADSTDLSNVPRSDQRSLAPIARMAFDRVIHATGIRAEHRSDDVLIVAFLDKLARGFFFDSVEVRALDSDDIQFHPGLRVVKSGHGFTSFMAAVVPLFAAGRRLHPQGESLLRVVLRSHIALGDSARVEAGAVADPIARDDKSAFSVVYGCRAVSGDLSRGVIS